MSIVSQESLEKFHKEGYLVVKDFFEPQIGDELKNRSDLLVKQADLSQHPKTIFKTTKDIEKKDEEEKKISHAMVAGGAMQANDKEDYFLSSSDKVHFFFEEKAFNSEGELIVDRSRAINKIGHYLHVLDPLFAHFSTSPKVKKLANDIGFIAPIILQSMVICKQPHIGGEVTAHRDSTFLTTVPSTAIGFWFALEDCTLQNSCLAFVPGTHKDGKSTKRMIRTGKMSPSINNVDLRVVGKVTVPDSDPSLTGPIQSNVALNFVGEDSGLTDYPESSYSYEPIKKGSMIVINGEVVHKSSENTSPNSRYIYTFHMIESYGTTYPVTNWLQSSKPFPHLFTPEEEAENIKQINNKA